MPRPVRPVRRANGAVQMLVGRQRTACQHVSPVPRSIPRTGFLTLAVLWRLTVRSYCCAKVRSSVSPTIVAKFLLAVVPTPHLPVADTEHLSRPADVALAP